MGACMPHKINSSDSPSTSVQTIDSASTAVQSTPQALLLPLPPSPKATSSSLDPSLQVSSSAQPTSQASSSSVQHSPQTASFAAQPISSQASPSTLQSNIKSLSPGHLCSQELLLAVQASPQDSSSGSQASLPTPMAPPAQGQGETTQPVTEYGRWASLGYAMVQVLVPYLQSFLEQSMKNLYDQLKKASPSIDQQSYNNYHKKCGNCTLEYKNINNNKKVSKRPPHPHFAYSVRCPVDLAKLFLQTHMCKFTTFNSADASALLGLIITVNDSICSQPRLVSMKTEARKMRETRNKWAHCHLKEWNVNTFNESFHALEELLKLCIPASDLGNVLNDLKRIQKYGPTQVTEEVTQSITRELVNTYSEQLNEFYKESVEILKQQRPLQYDLSRYVPLRLCTEKEMSEFKEIQAVNEYKCVVDKEVCEDIELEDLFTPVTVQQKLKNQRTVVMVGVPGGGKTITCFHLLDSIICRTLQQPGVKFPFFIRLRDINQYKDKLSLKSLLLNHHGPSSAKDKQQDLWAYLEKHQEEIMIILDGYDECEGLGANFKHEYTKTCTTTDQEQKAQVLIFNLIRGHLMKKTNIMVTTRPHCVDMIRQCHPEIRLVKLGTLNESRLEEFIKKDLAKCEQLCKEVIKYVKENRLVQELCSVPINARNFLDYINWIHEGEISLNTEMMPKTVAGLLLVLVIKMLQVLDRSLVETGGIIMNPEKILVQKRMLIQNMARLAYSGVVRESKQLFSEEDLASCSLHAASVEGSIMTCSRITVRGAIGLETKCFFAFPHLTQQEHLAAIYLTQRPVEEMEELIWRNEGQHDSLLSMYLGCCGDKIAATYLPCIYPDTDCREYKTKARRILQAAWTSPRLYEGLSDDDGFPLSLWYSSQQWDMAPELQPRLGAHRGQGRPAVIPLRETASLSCYLQHLCGSAPESKNASSTQSHANQCLGVWIRDELRGTEDMKQVKTLVNQNPNLTSLRLRSWTESAWTEWFKGEYPHLQCVWLYTPIRPFTKSTNLISLQTVCRPLQHCKHLDTLTLEWDNEEGRSVTEALSLLPPTLKHLNLWEMHRKGNITDVFDMCEWILKSNLTSLHLHYIQIEDIQASQLSRCVHSDLCPLITLRMQGCRMSKSGCESVCEALRHNERLCVLKISGKNRKDVVGPVSHLLTVNNTITELDIKGYNADTSDLSRVLLNESLRVLNLSDTRGLLLPQCTRSWNMPALCRALALNVTICVLLLEECYLDDASVHQLTAGLAIHPKLKTLSLRRNNITVSSVGQLLERTSLEALDVRMCSICTENDEFRSMEDGNHSTNCSCSSCRLAQAVCTSHSLQLLGLGGPVFADGEGYDTAPQCLAAFLYKLRHSYPYTTLQTLYIDCDDRSVVEAGAALTKQMNKPSLITRCTDVEELTDSGHWWCSLPKDRHYWLLQK